jgi:hypothetical protein
MHGELGMTLSKSHPRAKQRWALLVAMVAVLVMALAAVTLAVHDLDEFELDKDATGNTTFARIGDLGQNINATTTAIPVCQLSATNPPNGSIILIEAERMTINSVQAGSFGGNCSPGVKRQYNVASRAATGVVHQKGDVKGYVSLITAYTPTPADGPDWNQVHSVIGSDPKCETLGLAECAFVSDQIGPSIFIGGASKDHLPISGWQWTTGGSPDKAEIINAYAAKAIDDNEDQILYFGMDRWAVDGSTDIGFWFFQDAVVACPDSSAPADACDGIPDGMFAGEHTGTLLTDGDILALATFTQGGAETTIRVFRWVGSGGNESGSIEGPDADAGDCIQDPPLTDDELCGTVNNTTIEVPWTYTFKGAAVGKWVPAGGLFEGGINLSALGLEGCFSSFLAETRSSPEITAILKDFALGQFEACDTELTTTPSDANGDALTDTDGNTVPDAQLGTGAAGVDVTDTALLDVKGTSTWSGTLDFYLCGPFASGPVADDPNTPADESGLCSEGGVQIDSQSVSDQDGTTTFTSAAANVTEAGYYCWRGEFLSGDDEVPDATDARGSECFEVLPVRPTLTTTSVVPSVGLSPTIVDSLADLNGDDAADAADDAAAFYGDTAIIDGGLDCDAWAAANDGSAGDGVIGTDDDCTLIGVDGSALGVEITVEDGAFVEANGDPIADGTALPTVFNAGDPDNADIGDSDFAWSTRFGRVDANGDEAIDNEDCHVGIAGVNILGEDCGYSPATPPALNGYVDIDGDSEITSADECDGCFFGFDVFNGLVAAVPIDFGDPVYDAATLLGTAYQPGDTGHADYPSINGDMVTPADGTITFTLVGPDDDPEFACDSEADLAGGTGTNPQGVAVTGDDHYVTAGFIPSAPGVYHWKASYDGDSPNTLGTSHNDACDESGEEVTVRQIPTTISTRQRVYPNDAARVASSEPGVLLTSAGSVTFRLYDSLSNCQLYGTTLGEGGLLYEEEVALTGGTQSEVVTTDNTTIELTATTASTVYWWVTFDPGDDVFTGRQSDCQENVSVTFVNDSGPGTLWTPPNP